jgi:hypothetical protein
VSGAISPADVERGDEPFDMILAALARTPRENPQPASGFSGDAVPEFSGDHRCVLGACFGCDSFKPSQRFAVTRRMPTLALSPALCRPPSLRPLTASAGGHDATLAEEGSFLVNIPCQSGERIPIPSFTITSR